MFDVGQSSFVLTGTKYLGPRPGVFKDGRVSGCSFVVSGPPCFGLPGGSSEMGTIKGLMSNRAGVCTLFVSLSSYVLGSSKRVVCVAPQDFTSKGCFRSFEGRFFAGMTVNFVRLFGAEDKAFTGSRILRRLVVLDYRPINYGYGKAVAVSFDRNLRSLRRSCAGRCPTSRVISTGSSSGVICLPMGVGSRAMLGLFES